ncbi:hypothetical protein ACFL19_00060 [Pseudomonadota bacterium]
MQSSPDGQKAHTAYEHLNGYYEACIMQYSRIYELWRVSSAIPVTPEDQGAFQTKRKAMQQVVRDIHFLLISLQVIWKTLQTMCNASLYPSFADLIPLQDKWASYFEQYREPRNTFEHYDDQVLGSDTRNNNPGYGVSLSADGGFNLGVHQKVDINEDFYQQLIEFKHEFEAAIDSILEKTTIDRAE